MARAVWSGVISFGLVSVPVAAFTATEEHQPAFHQFAANSTDRIRYQRVNQRTGEEVDQADIVKGVEVGDDEFVMVTDEELEAIAPGRSRALEISAFVELAEIDPIHFNKAYYLAPAAAENARTYALLREAMAATGRAAVATFVMHGKAHLAAVRPSGNVLVLETLFFADEVRDPHQVLEHLPAKPAFGKGELAMATQLIESMGEDWKPERYHNVHTERVEELIEAKRKGNEIRVADEAPATTDVVDLLDALRRSVASARGAREKAADTKQTPATKKAPTKRAPAKRAPAKKAAAGKTPRKAS